MHVVNQRIREAQEKCDDGCVKLDEKLVHDKETLANQCVADVLKSIHG